MDRNEAAETAVHSLRSANAAVKSEADAESLDLFVKGPELFMADILVEHIGRHHHTDEAELFDGIRDASRFRVEGGTIRQT